MKIKDVEKRTGITSYNIRFYEKENLLIPKRNPVNGYREYTPEDIKQILQIKILRKLDVPIEEIPGTYRRIETAPAKWELKLSSYAVSAEKLCGALFAGHPGGYPLAQKMGRGHGAESALAGRGGHAGAAAGMHGLPGGRLL